MQILSYPQNPRVAKARIVGAFVGIDVPEETPVDLSTGANRTPEFLALNPFGQVPTLVHENEGVFESSSIARYIARLGEGKKNLLGATPLEQSRVDAFLDVIVSFENFNSPIIGKIFKAPWATGFSREFVEMCQARTKKTLEGFEEAFKSKKGGYLVGDDLTLADIAWYTACTIVVPRFLTKAYVEKELPLSWAQLQKLSALPEFAFAGPLTPISLEKEPEFQYAGPTAPVRFHRLVTITDGKTTMKLKLFPESSSTDVQDAIRARFRLAESAKLILVDEDDCDVIIDGTLETATYKLSIL